MAQPDVDTDLERERSFLEKDFEQWSSSYWRNEALGEKRLNFFIGLVTAVFGGLGFLAKDGAKLTFGNDLQVVSLGTLVVLLAMGLLTLFRIVHRNEVTDGYIDALRIIRERLVSSGFSQHYMSKLPPNRGRPLWNGGLAYYVLVINASLCGLIPLTVPALNGEAILKSALCIVGALVATLLQGFWIAHRRSIASRRSPSE